MRIGRLDLNMIDADIVKVTIELCWEFVTMVCYNYMNAERELSNNIIYKADRLKLCMPIVHFPVALGASNN